MRILHVIPSISPRRGGPSQAVLAMVAAQRSQGLDAAIVTTNDDGDGVLPELTPHHWQLVQGVPVLAFPRWSPPLRPLREFAIAPSLVQWLRRHAQDHDLLHIHALFSFPTTTAMALARHQQMPYILRTIGQLQHWSLQQSHGRKRLLLHMVERRNLEGAAALHFTSLAEQQEAAAMGLSTPSFVLPLGVDLPPPRPQPSGVQSAADQGAAVQGAAVQEDAVQEDAVQLLFLSRLHPKKQLPLLFEALAQLRQRAPTAPWQLQIAGDGDPAYVIELQRHAQRLGLADQVRWHGFVQGDAKTALFHGADWFVLPSAAENFGIAAAEALAYGVPVLLSPGVALAEQVAKAGAGYCVEPTSTELATALARAVERRPSPQMRQAARQLAAQQFGWLSITSQLLLRYEALSPQSHR